MTIYKEVGLGKVDLSYDKSSQDTGLSYDSLVAKYDPQGLVLLNQENPWDSETEFRRLWQCPDIREFVTKPDKKDRVVFYHAAKNHQSIEQILNTELGLFCYARHGLGHVARRLSELGPLWKLSDLHNRFGPYQYVFIIDLPKVKVPRFTKYKNRPDITLSQVSNQVLHKTMYGEYSAILPSRFIKGYFDMAEGSYTENPNFNDSLPPTEEIITRLTQHKKMLPGTE